MIKLYDVAKDDEFHPYLIEIKAYDVDSTITTTSEGIGDLLTKQLNLGILDTEKCFLIALDMYNRAIGIYLIGLGDYKSNQMYNRNIAVTILLSGARKFFVAHNHPDGALFLSDGDKANTMVFTVLSQLLEVDFLASYVVTKDGYINDKMNKPIYFKKRK